MTELLKTAQQTIQHAQQQQTKYANEYRREESFEIGEKVLLSGTHITLASQSTRPSRKLIGKFIGPYKILDKISSVSYKLELPNTMKIHPVFHVSLLRRYTSNNDEEFAGRITQPPPPIVVNDEIE